MMNTDRLKRYTLYIDELGDHTKPIGDRKSRDFFGVTGVILLNEEHTNLTKAMDSIKNDVFDADKLTYPVVFHREDIIGRKGIFTILLNKDKQIEFDARMLDLYNNQKYIIVTAVIDKHFHSLKYGQKAYDPYHYALLMLLERYVEFLFNNNGEGDVMVESRGKNENNLADAIYQDFHNSGSFYRAAAICQLTLTSKNLKIKDKSVNIAGLQLADLLANTSKLSILMNKQVIQDGFTDFEILVCNCMENKYLTKHNSTWVWGYGKIFKT